MSARVSCDECGWDGGYPGAFPTVGGVTRCVVCDHEKFCDDADCAWCSPIRDPYDTPIFIRSRIPRLSHMHSEPVCAFPECETYLTRDDMRAMRAEPPPP